MTDLIDNILDSISLIVDKKIESLKFDKTSICTVLDDSKAYQGK